ncbi:MAG: transcription-repair coupling factor [Dehalococcoidia bacterium]|nr:transcription-repair coupling factor [Dehalococcoidia bacterium]
MAKLATIIWGHYNYVRMADEGQSLNLSCLLSVLKDTPAFRELAAELSEGKSELQAVLLDAARPYLIAALYEELNLPLLVVTAQPEGARRLYEQLRAWCSTVAWLHRLPELDFLPYSSSQLSVVSYQTLERLRALAALALYGEGDEQALRPSSGRQAARQAQGRPLIVTSALAIMSKTVPQSDFVAACHVLEPGMSAEPLELMRRWQGMGYETEEVVELPGQMSRRGGIVDVFPPCSQLPLRLEFFGNQIESMRFFDPESQRSSSPVSSLMVTPAKEFLIPSRGLVKGLNLDGCTAEVKQRFQADLGKLQEGQGFPGAEFYAPLFNTGSVFDYLDSDALLVLDDPEGIELSVTRINEEAQALRDAKTKRGELPEGFPAPYFSWREIEGQMQDKSRLALLNAVSYHLPAGATQALRQSSGQALRQSSGQALRQGSGQALPFTRAQAYGSQLERFLKSAGQMVEQRQRVVVVSHQADRLAELLQREGIHTPPVSGLERMPPPGSITVVKGSVDGGWVMDDRLIIITDAELFGFVKQPQPRKKKPVPHRWFLPQLSTGDYVVHVDHGIARFHGLTRMSSDGTEREYLVLEYAGGDRLYVPTDRIDRISRYIGTGDHAPPLSRLRTPEWQRTKKRVEESVAEIAQELLALYAAREVAPGFAFSGDSLWQQELEASFPYMETPDQIEAIMAVKEDMERPRPTDRLICGDVGYGKTEIALRAAFKAVMDNKQVAVLVPTTVLAQQHLTTFTERLQTFPLRVEMLSRFCPPEKEREVLAGLAVGAVDICIGTHRLLQKDVVFKDLGLVIIDEEQQFGVVQKDKLKQMRREVDTLALSATPIPRTLHMSLTGIRDMSIVETPPEERLSVKTYVGAYDAALVRQVVLRELERNGQVFFVHNRVQSIALAASRLQESVPEARMATAHGQMPEEQLEKVMADFMAGRHDVLVTTTIIQLGLDMPNVNTLIVDRADKFGLAQLYQLRGRVGRGINQAYAYFFFDRGRQLSPQAYKRLRTIVEATELGSGFGIAMKDLEIRGAGNLLGVKQSGHIAALGFELYCQLLAEAVEELESSRNLALQGRRTGEGGMETGAIVRAAKQSPSIALPLDAHIPEEYVCNLSTRLTLYHRLAGVEHIEEVDDMAREFRDRFGPLPEPVESLLYMVRVKVLASGAGVSSISTQGRHIVLKPREDGIAIPDGIRAGQSLGRHYGASVKIGATQIRLDTRLLGERWRGALLDLLTSYLGRELVKDDGGSGIDEDGG